jgi:hypothetical protein
MNALASGQSFLVASPLPAATSGFLSEVGILQSQGYTLVGNFFVPPAP